MTSIKKLSGFRQLSLNCDSPPNPPRRPPLKKQFSEDINDFKAWSEHDIGIKISLNNRSLRNPFIKNAWVESTQETVNDEPVIIKKCSENRRVPLNSLTRQISVDKEALLHSRQELAERLRKTAKPQEEKPNIKIFLAQNSKEQIDEYEVEKEDKINEQPKFIQPLITVNSDKHSFKLRKNAKQRTILFNTSDSSWPVPKNKSNQNSPVIVVPPTENGVLQKPETFLSTNNPNDVKAIDSVIIRPATAASKREMFQKRTNSAFNSTVVAVKETQKLRSPLIRSSSAPCKPEHLKSKLILTKHSKHSKTLKKVQMKPSVKNEKIEKLNEENPKSQKELNRTTPVQGNDVVTMVSLISPTGSDGEEEEVEESKDKNKTATNEKSAVEQKQPPKIMSLRKAAKTVSFQQSSIHAIRSFSASFPARRVSVTAAMMLNNSLNSPAKVQEKRSTNSSTPDDDERVPKRRLVRSNTEDAKSTSFEQENIDEPENDSQKESTTVSNFTVDIKSNDIENQQVENKQNVQGTEQLISEPIQKETESSKETEMETKENPDLKSPKEKQCWNMYCKMAEKGINISFDTILRGMLTPTEYRLSKKHLLAATSTEPSENVK
ncbi:repetitive organellar protein [Diabrotica virgifera virgifera]|uniref:Uncharacterized protein n=1 Tax=Diabrotica virgifera virgifera TaxID=50390 RepID=A0ABM5JQ02_DIAVI|nr:repetitive organellar protein [Diabrotica virgifera virgifera]